MDASLHLPSLHVLRSRHQLGHISGTLCAGCPKGASPNRAQSSYCTCSALLSGCMWTVIGTIQHMMTKWGTTERRVGSHTSGWQHRLCSALPFGEPQPLGMVQSAGPPACSAVASTGCRCGAWAVPLLWLFSREVVAAVAAHNVLLHCWELSACPGRCICL